MPSPMKALHFISALLLLGGLFHACDSERFLGYNYSAEQIPETAPVEGRVTNQFTLQPVGDAAVLIGSQIAFTDTNGFFSLNYFVQPDDQRNKPVPVIITAENYYPDTTSLVIFPQNNYLEIALEYAAPIIEDAIQKDDLCQVIITDYQGPVTLDSVSVTFTYWYERVSSTEVVYPLKLIRVEGSKGFFQTRIELFYPEYGALKQDVFTVYARDREGFEDKKHFSTFNAKSLLF